MVVSRSVPEYLQLDNIFFQLNPFNLQLCKETSQHENSFCVSVWLNKTFYKEKGKNASDKNLNKGVYSLEMGVFRKNSSIVEV